MQRIVEDNADNGFTPFLGEIVTLLCMNYFYTGRLIGANADFVELEDPAIVYETGPWTDNAYSDVQKLPTNILRVRTAAIEAYGKLK